MSAIESFKFGESYLLRPAGNGAHLEDLELAVRWTAADPDHAGRVEPGFWLEQRLGRDSYMLEDAGGPLFFFKLHWWYRAPEEQAMHPVDGALLPSLITLPWNGMERLVEIHIQFAPRTQRNGSVVQVTELDARVAAALNDGVVWLERALQPARVQRIFFDSSSERLIQFCTKRLGFQRDQADPGKQRLWKPLFAKAADADGKG